MPPYKKPSVDEILRKHSARISKQMGESEVVDRNYSREYTIFKEEMAPEYSRYERWCNNLGKVIKIKPSEKDRKKIGEQLKIAHLDIEAGQALSLSFLTLLGTIFFGILISVSIALIKGGFEYFP